MKKSDYICIIKNQIIMKHRLTIHYVDGRITTLEGGIDELVKFMLDEYVVEGGKIKWARITFLI